MFQLLYRHLDTVRIGETNFFSQLMQKRESANADFFRFNKHYFNMNLCNSSY